MAGLELSEMPPEMLAMIAKCTSLKCLDLSDNKFKELPMELSNLIKLKELILSENKLQAIPDKVLIFTLCTNNKTHAVQW